MIRIRLEKNDFSIRRSQLIVPFGVGSIVNMLPNESLMLCSLDKWEESAGEKVYDERLQECLKVKYFKIPASKENYPKGLPFIRFPKWYYCPNCRSLKSLDEWKKRWVELNHRDFDHPKCYMQKCKKTMLNPSRFIIACIKGHIDDFPWMKWVHRDNKCSNPDLELISGRGIAGLGGIKIRCRTCSLEKTMAESFNKDIFKKIGFKCTGRKPWQDTGENCKEFPITLQRGASNVYFPQLVSSICIPPYSDDICSAIQKTMEWQYLSSKAVGISEKLKKELIMEIAKKVNISEKGTLNLVGRMLKSITGDFKRQLEVEYRNDEYRALGGNIKIGQKDSKNFSIEVIAAKEYKIYGIKKVTLAHRLREIRTLVSFSRINPVERNYFGDMGEDIEDRSFSMRIAEKADREWLPAVEVRGEGIFLMFDMNSINKWKNNKEIKKRSSQINLRFSELCRMYRRPLRTISSLFLLLHTFAHVLMRQLSFECGYSTASLRERIYCYDGPNSQTMAGILIYTATGDSEGSMGGLVRQGRLDKLSEIIAKAIRNASWCSSDPACIENSGQGLGSLNLAACYACVLLPETSCEVSNRFLDRAMLIGLPDNPEIGFFSSLL